MDLWFEICMDIANLGMCLIQGILSASLYMFVLEK